MELTESEENYLKSIYNLQLKQPLVNTNTLAAYLESSAASITDMLKKLQVKKLVEYKKYHGFKLNATGMKEALKIVRRHRLWESFLVGKLGMDWEKVHDIAEKLEHISSNELIERLDKFLESPKIDPHGDPIPDAKGNLPVIHQIPLKDLPIGHKGVVSSVSNQSVEMMEMLNHYRIGIGTGLTVLKSFGFDKSLQIKVARQPECIISGLVAENIFVYDN